ncbi:hypothetical protein [Cupriavidus sp. M-11]|uniref:hypothetical protein n=1 Tax=Cupriavidus sp. M-11 TaxID=3233038 RepID=UPI003F900C52
MTLPLKKALQPAHPSEKPRNCAISPPSCQRGVPVYPLRYGIADTRPDTVGARPYLLAPETEVANTVYLMVSETLLSHARLWRIETNKDGIRDKLATQLSPAGDPRQRHVFDAVHLATATPELVTPAISGRARPCAWSEIALGDRIMTYQSILTGMYGALPPSADGASDKRVKPLAAVLQDPIGITSELAHLTAVAAAERQIYEIDNNHAYTSATLIKQYLSSVQKQTTSEFYLKRQRLVRYYESDNANTIDGNAMPFIFAYQRKIKTLQETLDKCAADLDGWVKTAGSAIGKGWSDGLFGKALSCFDLGSHRNAQDYENVVARCAGSLTHSAAGRDSVRDLVLADHRSSPVWLALAHGIPELHANFTNPDILKQALDTGVAAFAPIFQFNISHPATPHSDALINLMLPLLADKTLPDAKADLVARRVRLFAEIRVGSTVVTYRVTSAEANRQYAQFRGEQHMNTEQLRKWGITVKRELRGQPATTLLYEEVPKGAGKDYISPAPAGEGQKFRLEGNIFQRTLQRLQGSRAYAATQKGIVAGEYAVTGVAAVSAVMSLRSSLKDFAQGKMTSGDASKRATSIVAAFAAISAVLSASYYIKGDILQLRGLAKGGALNVVRGSQEVIAARTLATKFGAGAAFLSAAADLLRASKAYGSEQNTEAAKMFMASAGCGTLVGASLLLNAVGVTLSFMGPVGWLILAAVATVGVTYFSIQAAMARFQPDEVWLAHSFWSQGDARYRFKTLEDELAAFHGAIYGVRVVADWDSPASAVPFSLGNIAWRTALPLYGLWQDAQALHREVAAEGVGTLSISLSLPSYREIKDQSDETDKATAAVAATADAAARFQKELRVYRGKKPLRQVEGPIVTSPEYRFPYDDECLIASSDAVRDGTRVLTWRISMRADARVELDYCYRPDPKDQPMLALMPQREPLEFTRGTWLTDPIDSDLLEPVKVSR